MKRLYKCYKAGISVVVLLLCMTMMQITIKSQADKIGTTDYDVAVKCGIDGVVKVEKAALVDVTIKSKKSDFQGTLKITFYNSDEEYFMAYDNSITLTKGEPKNISFSVAETGKYYQVQLYTKKGTLVYQNEYSIFRKIAANSVSVGMLSDRNDDLKYWGEMQLIPKMECITEVVSLNAKNFPDNLTQMEQLDYLVIDDFATNKLTKQQYDVMMQWVHDGGNLIIGLGEHYEKSYHIFQKDYPLKMNNMVTDELYFVKEENNAKKKGITVEGITFENDNFEKDTSILSGEMIYKRTIGNGCMCLLGFQLSHNNICKSEYKELLAKELMLSFEKYIDKLRNEVSQNDAIYNLEDATDYYHDVKPLNTALYVVILVIYVLCIGPGIYIVLKKKGKREKIYQYVVLIACTFTVIIGILSSFKRVRQNVLTSLTVFNDTLMEDADIYTTFMPIKSGNTFIRFDAAVDNLYVKTENMYHFNIYGGNSYTYSINEGFDKNIIMLKENELVYQKKNATSFSKIAGTAKLKNSKDTKTFECNLKANRYSVSGTIKNISAYDLEDVIVYHLGYFISIPELKKGETYEIKESDKRNAIDTSVNCFQEQENKKSMNEDNMFQTDNARIQDYIYDRYIKTPSTTYIQVFGIVKEYHADYAKGNTMEYNKAVVMTQVKSDYYNDATYLVDIGNWCLMECSNYWDIGEDGLAYEFSEGDFSYAFDSTKKPKVLRLSSALDEKRLKMKVYNFQTGEYDDVFADGSTTIEGEELLQYVNEGELKIQYISVLGKMKEESKQGFDVPRIDVLLVEDE